uniref:Odorant receptor 7 n=1 Tax=Sclerodermus sp. MQW-2015 TaxID=1729718 RepID=A0A0N9JMR6_9HYME|nr:odorant receptor 7 [Sclerodermus sp. MQW-2015]
MLQLGLSMILAVMDNFNEVVQYAIITSGVLLNLLFNSYPGQILMDHSIDISNKAYSGNWYDAPPKFQRLFLMIIRRGSEPCCISAGKMVILTLSSFSTVNFHSIDRFLRSSQISE